MTIKRWITIGIAYVAIVIIGYGFISGTNPFISTDMHENEHVDMEEHE